MFISNCDSVGSNFSPFFNFFTVFCAMYVGILSINLFCISSFEKGNNSSVVSLPILKIKFLPLTHSTSLKNNSRKLVIWYRVSVPPKTHFKVLSIVCGATPCERLYAIKSMCGELITSTIVPIFLSEIYIPPYYSYY